MTENRPKKSEAEKKAIAERLIREQTIQRLIEWGSIGIDSEYNWRPGGRAVMLHPRQDNGRT